MERDVTNLIPDLSSWNDGAGISISSWIGCIGRFDHAVGYASIFWPDFVVYDGCVLLQTPSAENFHNWMQTLDGDRAEVEGMLNHRHITDLFRSESKPTKEIVLYLGRVLKEMWTAKLKHEFPQLSFKVEFDECGSDNLVDCQITLFQLRNG